MVNLIISILFWCMSENKKLGNAAIFLSICGVITDMIVNGWWCIIDVAILIINIYIYNSITKKGKE